MSDSWQPHGLQHARLPCPSLSPRACSNSWPLSWWCHSTISSSVSPFSSCPQSFPALGSFPTSWLSASGGQSIGASASVLSMNIQGWFPLGVTGLFSRCPGNSEESSLAPPSCQLLVVWVLGQVFRKIDLSRSYPTASWMALVLCPFLHKSAEVLVVSWDISVCCHSGQGGRWEGSRLSRRTYVTERDPTRKCMSCGTRGNRLIWPYCSWQAFYFQIILFFLLIPLWWKKKD